MHMVRTKDQPRKPEACDYCAGADVPDMSHKTVQKVHIFPYGTFVLCGEHRDELGK